MTRPAVSYRQVDERGDFAGTYELFLRAANDLRARSHRQQLQDTLARRSRALAFREHACTHDRAGFWIAECDGERVGFGIATSRTQFWHLNALHVLPAYQSMGVGQELLRRCLAYGRADGVVSTVISEASQPVSNALYARQGMYQWLPLVHVECGAFGPHSTGRRRGVLASTPTGDAPTLAALDTIDRAVLGFSRNVDHRFWTGLDDQQLLLLHVGDRPIGYAYISRFGGIGPCAVVSTAHLPRLLAASIDLAREQGIERVSFVVPGLASGALRYLLDHSGRYQADMTLLLSSRPFGRLDRYLLPASDALF